MDFTILEVFRHDLYHVCFKGAADALFDLAVALLTDTSEGAFQSVAQQLERVTTAPSRTRRTPARRAAARKGQSIAEIAAIEGVSEGEVRLRLHLAGQTMEEAHGPVRS